MFRKRTLFLAAILTFSTYPLAAKSIDMNTLSGNWHLRVMDGKEVRKARAILDFNTQEMLLSGFDGCNRITGTLKKDVSNNLSAKLTTTKMACRGRIHTYVSQRLHETVNEGFSIKEDKKYGVEGITLKSSKHELFFKRMGKDSKWF